MTRTELRDRIALHLEIRRPLATRVCHWLWRLHDEVGAVHGEVGLVRMLGSTQGVGVLIATVDYQQHAVGCAWCGEWIADHKEALTEGTRSLLLDNADLPRELQPLDLRPAVIYCGSCWASHGSILRDRLEIAGAP